MTLLTILVFKRRLIIYISFRTALMLRLGVPFNDRPRNCKCKDFKVVDDHLDQILCCKQNSGEIKGRHNAIVREFKSLVNHAGYQFTDARLGELRTIYNDNYMAADGCIRGLRDKPLHIDVTIANPTGPSYLHNGNSSQIKHFAIKDKEKLKNDKYLRRCQDKCYVNCHETSLVIIILTGGLTNNDNIYIYKR